MHPIGKFNWVVQDLISILLQILKKMYLSVSLCIFLCVSQIRAETMRGNIAGARLLLSRLVKNEAGWFYQFLEALEETGHRPLADELRGGSSESSGNTCTTNTS